MDAAPDAVVVVLCADGDRVLVDANGALPSRRRPILEHEGALTPAWADWPEFGLPGLVLDTLLDPTRGRGGNEPYVSLVVIDTPSTDHRSRAGLRWQTHAAALNDVPAGFADHVDRWLAERRGALPSHQNHPNDPNGPGRLPWNDPSWFARVETWVNDSLAGIGRAAPTSITMTKMWGISAVFRVDAPDGVSWFKASSPYFVHEAATTRILQRALPDRLPVVLATHDAEGWLLTEHLDGPVGGQEIIDSFDPAEMFTDIHRRSAAVMDELIAVGCPHRPIAQLPALVRRGLATEVGRRYCDLDSVSVDDLVRSVQEAVAYVEALGVPETVVHGDLHGGNVARTSRGAVVFDWSDACRSHPVVDVVSWTEMFRGDASRVQTTWESLRDAWVEQFDVRRFEPNVRLLELVGQAYLFDSYIKILDAIEPVRHRECSAGITDALDRMVELTQATS